MTNSLPEKSNVVDYLLKLLVPLFIAICSFALESVRSELRELRADVKAMRSEYVAQVGRLSVKIAKLEAQHDKFDRNERAAD